MKHLFSCLMILATSVAFPANAIQVNVSATVVPVPSSSVPVPVNPDFVGWKKTSVPYEPSFGNVEEAHADDDDYVSRLDQLPLIPPASSSYVVDVAWGSDGNPSAFTINGNSKKGICLYDDLNGEAEKNRRLCEQVTARYPAQTFSKIIEYSRYHAWLREDGLPKVAREVANYQTVYLDFVGRKFKAETLIGNFVLMTLPLANAATHFRARDWSCPGYQTRNSLAWHFEKFNDKGVLDRVREKTLKVEFVANQNHVDTKPSLLNESETEVFFATQTEMHLELYKSWGYPSVDITKVYSCKYENGYSVLSSHRTCMGAMPSLCQSSQKPFDREDCRPRYVTKGARLVWAYVKEIENTPEAVIGVSTSTNKPIKEYTYEAAKTFCNQDGDRFPTLSELTEIVESRDLLSYFNYSHWIWASDGVTGEHNLYSLDAVANLAPSPRAQGPDAMKGYMVCVRPKR